MQVTLIFPPATDPRAPHLGLPYLAAVLRRAGISTRLIDADIGGLIALLRPDAISRSVQTLRQAAPASTEGVLRLLSRGEMLVEEIPKALATLRDKEAFYDVHRFHAAREALFDSLDLACAASGRAIRYNLCPIQYEIEGIDEQSLDALIAATADRQNNLFEDYWETELFPSIEAQSPDLIGISIVNRQQILPGLTLARRLRERGFFVVIGGTVFTKFVTRLMQLPSFFAHFADGVVVYEGETAILELVSQLGSRRDFSRVPNFLFVQDGRVRLGKTHVEDVDELPVPDFDDLPLHDYLAPQPVLPILVGKGCYFNECKFCDIPFINHVSKKPYRVRDPQKIVQDILELNARFGCEHFEITDEALPPRLLEKIADELKPHQDRRFSFTGYARLEPGFTPEVCGKLAGMGMKKLFFGLESGDQETLDHMKKGIKIENARPVLVNCHQAGIHFHVFSIVGFPEETEKRAQSTLQFFQTNRDVIDHPGNSFDLHPFGLELRTEYFANAERLGLRLPPEALQGDFVIGVKSEWSNTRGLSQQDVTRLVTDYNQLLRRTYRRFHNSRFHLWPGFEEYAVLYADHFRGREFPFRTALPDSEEEGRFSISWCPDTVLELDKGWVRVSSRWKSVMVTDAAYRVLGSRRPRTLFEFLNDCVAVNLLGEQAMPEAAIRDAINELIGERLLQVSVEKSQATGGFRPKGAEIAVPTH